MYSGFTPGKDATQDVKGQVCKILKQVDVCYCSLTAGLAAYPS